MNGHQHQRFIVAFSLVPLVATLAGAFLFATGNVSGLDLALFFGMYVLAGLGVSTGYHRLLAHRSFRVARPLRIAFATAGAIAGQGPPLTWVAHHRRHHRISDKTGDPHSPYLDEHGREMNWPSGLWHAHVGWLLNPELASDPMRFCPDLARDRDMRWISNNFTPIVLAGLLMPAVIALMLTGSLVAAATGVLWGGFIRMFVSNNVTYAVNSIGHLWGKRTFPTPDESRNVAALALFSFGEAWHNNHHAFPRSAAHGLRWYQVDISAIVISSLERLHLATDVVRIDRATQNRVAQERWSASAGGRLAASTPDVPLASRSRARPSPRDIE